LNSVIGQRRSISLSVDGLTVSIVVVGFVNVGVAVAETNVPSQPWQFSCPPILQNVVTEFRENDGQQDDFEDDENGHVVDAGFHGTKRVVVERDQRRSLQFGKMLRLTWLKCGTFYFLLCCFLTFWIYVYIFTS
jgi:hypothetical protein